MKFISAYVVFFLMLTTGSVYGDTIKIKKQFGDELLNPQQIIVTNGEVLVLDRGDETVKIYGEAGTYKSKIGGKGEGPGEANFATTFFVDKEKIYIHDSMRWQLNVFRKSDKKFLHFKRYSLIDKGYSPLACTAAEDGSFYFSTATLLKGQKAIVKFDNQFKPVMAFLDCIPVYKDEHEYISAKTLTAKTQINYGYVAASGKHLYFTYFLLNKVLKFSKDGKLLNEYNLPLESIDKTVKVIKFGDGSSDLERRLNYDLKVRHGIVYILSRNDEGQSILFELKKGTIKETARIAEPLYGFDISNNKLYGLDEEEGIIYIYDLPMK